jgi:hypothetical protein
LRHAQGDFSFIHVTPVAEAHLSNASPFQTPLITPNNKGDLKAL